MSIGKAAGTRTASQEAPEDLMSVREAAQVPGVSMATISLGDLTGARDWGQGQQRLCYTPPSSVTSPGVGRGWI